ncbi:unnamed protein product [Brassica oleracea]
MKIIVMFLSVIVLVSSGKFIFGAVNTMKISNLEERTHIFSPLATPLMNVQINDLQDEYRQGHGGSSLRRSNHIKVKIARRWRCSQPYTFFSLLPPISLPSLLLPFAVTDIRHFSSGRSATCGRRTLSSLLFSSCLHLLRVSPLCGRESFVSAQIRSFWFRFKVSGGESRRVRAVAVSPMWCVRYQLGRLLGFPLRLRPGLVCFWLALTRSLVAGFLFLLSLGLSVLCRILLLCPFDLRIWGVAAVLGSVCVQVWCCGPRATLASPNKMWGLGGVAVVDSLPSWVLRDSLAMELIGSGCIRSRVVVLEAAIFNALHRTTASSVARSSSCCR